MQTSFLHSLLLLFPVSILSHRQYRPLSPCPPTGGSTTHSVRSTSGGLSTFPSSRRMNAPNGIFPTSTRDHILHAPASAVAPHFSNCAPSRKPRTRIPYKGAFRTFGNTQIIIQHFDTETRPASAHKPDDTLSEQKRSDRQHSYLPRIRLFLPRQTDTIHVRRYAEIPVAPFDSDSKDRLAATIRVYPSPLASAEPSRYGSGRADDKSPYFRI